MRHLLLIPALLLALFIGISFLGMAEQQSLTGDTGLGALGGIEFVLLLILDALLFGAWFVCCEIHALRNQEPTPSHPSPTPQKPSSEDTIEKQASERNRYIAVAVVALTAVFAVLLVKFR